MLYLLAIILLKWINLIIISTHKCKHINVNLKNKITGKPAKSLTWIRINKKTNRREQIAQAIRQPHLQITFKRSELNNYKYICAVRSTDGQIAFKPFNKSPSDPLLIDPFPNVKIVPIILDVREGGKVELLCESGKWSWIILFDHLR